MASFIGKFYHPLCTVHYHIQYVVMHFWNKGCEKCFIFVGQYGSNGLQLVQSIHPSELRLPGESNEVIIHGVSARSDAVLLYADYNNSAVKSLHLQSNEIELVFQESLREWRVCNARELRDEAGDLLVVTELMTSGGATSSRVFIARKKASTYKIEFHFPLESTTVQLTCI